MWLKRLAVGLGLICSAVTIVAGLGLIYEPSKWIGGGVLLAVGLASFVLLISDFYISNPQVKTKRKKAK